ncbi:hypothetical protein ACQPYH_18505 [Kribbella sp. CA-245084]|uniref:hypothetical protein n=1 Tax=Kribbella sp. CA-245084 TaxID=3239940 RepID=UPI003D8AC477
MTASAVEEAIGALPSEYGPYLLVVHELIPTGQRYESRSSIVKAGELCGLVDRGIWQYFIVSTTLSAALLDRLPDADLATFAVNGAINLQIGRSVADAPSLGMSPRVLTLQGEVKEHLEYATVFDAAVRRMRRGV